MAKIVLMSIKLEPALRDEFAKVAKSKHRPAAQIVRELMRAYIARQTRPNAETLPATPTKMISIVKRVMLWCLSIPVVS